MPNDYTPIHDAPAGHVDGRRYPASIAFLIEERPLLWYEDPEEYDALLREVFDDMKPRAALDCIFTKNAADCAWEFRRMRRLKQAAINYAMPYQARKLILPSSALWGHSDEAKVEAQAEAAAYGEMSEEDRKDFAERMHAARVTHEEIHYKALNFVAEELHWINQECDRIEDRFHRLIRDYERRNANLAAMARSLIERERAEVVDFKEVN